MGATLEKHLDTHGNQYSDQTIKSLKNDTYVDDIQGGGDSPEDIKRFKEEATVVLKKGGFELHKWHSNSHQFNELKQDETTSLIKTLGIQWDTNVDTFSVMADIPVDKQLTKRKVLSHINSVFDMHGWAAPLMVTAKLIFSEICKNSYHWDEKLPEEVATRWNKWRRALASHHTVTVPRSIHTTNNSKIELHGFADASKHAVCAAIYVVELHEGEPISQNLLVAKSRIAPVASIPRLELIAAHTLAKL